MKRNTLLFVGLLLLAGVLHIVSWSSATFFNTAANGVSSLIYIGLLLFWLESVRTRLLTSRTRNGILWIGLLMVSYLLIRIVEGRAREPLASPDEDGKVPKHEMLDVVDQGKKGFRDAPRIDLSRLDAEFLKQACQAAKDGREIHKNGEALRQDPGLGQMNV